MADDEISIKVKVNAETGQLEVVGAQLKNTAARAKEAEGSFFDLDKVTQNLIKSYLGFQGLSKVVEFFKESVTASMNFQETLGRVKFGLESSGISFDKNKESILSWANSIQAATKYDDDIALTSLERLIRVTGDLGQAQTATKLAMDMATVSKKDMGETVRTVIDLLNGNERALREVRNEYGGVIGKVDSTQEAIDKLQEKLTGAAEKETGLKQETEKLKNAFDDLKKSIGEETSPVLEKVIPLFTSAIEKITQFGAGKIALTASDLISGNVLLAIKDVRDGLKNINDEVDKGKQKTKDDDKPNKPGKLDPKKSQQEIAEEKRIQDKKTEELQKAEDERNEIRKSNLDAQLKGVYEAQEIEADILIQKNENEIKEQEKKDAALATMKQNFTSTLSDISRMANSENKELALLGKAASLGLAYINTAEAVTKALAAAPPPFNFALAAAVGAAGAAQIGVIASTALEKGGVIPGSAEGTHIIAGEKGKSEAVLPLDDTGAMKKIARAINDNSEGGGGGVTNVYVNLSAQTLSIDKGVAVLDAIGNLIAQKTPGARKFARNLNKLQNQNSGLAT